MTDMPKTELVLKHVFDDAAKARVRELVEKAAIIWGDSASADDAVTNDNNFHFRRSLLGMSVESAELHEQAMNYLGQLEYGVYL